MDYTGESYPDGSTNILLAVVTLHGHLTGSTTLHGTIQVLGDNYGGNYLPSTTLTDGTIIVNSPPTAMFSTNLTSGTAPLPVKFTDASTGTAPLSYAWDFTNDGTTDSTLQNPVYTYPAAGSYTAKLTVTNPAGSNSVTRVITVNPAPVAPTALFSTNVTSGTAPLVVKFTSTSTGTAPLSYAWDFTSDGTTDSPLQNPTYTYSVAGSYTAKLSVTNPAGSSFVTHVITVNGAVKPVAGFTSNVTSGASPLAVKFTDTSSNSPTSWSWNFGDGAVSMERNSVHVYTKSGRYTVLLTATNAAGSSSLTKRNYLTVTTGAAGPTAAFSTNVTSGTSPLSVKFTDASTGTAPLSYAWDFTSDGITDSTLQNPAYTYTTAGSYSAKLTVSNAAGSSSVTRVITATSGSVKPAAAFSANVTSGKAPLSVKFADASGNTPTSWSWDFGDSGISTQQNPVHIYAKSGRYAVKLTAANSAGSSTVTKKNYITVT